MKKFAVIVFMFLISCVSSHNPLDRAPQGLTYLEPSKMYSVEVFERLQPKIEESKKWRERSGEFNKMIEAKNTNKQALTAQETNDFFAEARKYLAIRKELFDIKNKYQFLVDPGTLTKVVLNEPTSKSSTGGTTYTLNPKDPLGYEFLFGLRISMTAALTLYDSFVLGIKPHYDNKLSRAKLKLDANSEYEGEFDLIVKSFFNQNQRDLLAKAMTIFIADYNLKKQYEIPVTDQEKYLDDEILNSPFYNFMLSEGAATVKWRDRIELQKRQAQDSYQQVKNFSSFALSFVFGNVVGGISTEKRKGDLLKLTKPEKDYIISKMKPFDILLEKTPFKATDTFIPGYYGHVAVYLGTKKQLEDAGLWDILGKEMQDMVATGHTILEALRYDERGKTVEEKLRGVQLNTLDHFLNIDEFLVVRLREEPTQAQLVTFMKNAKAQYGKQYDFNFDIESKNKIVCSELAYVIFTDKSIEWPNAKSVGRFTISPDHVMTLAFPGKPFHPILMYDKNGVRKENTETMDLSMELFRNVQANYMDMVYVEESIYKNTTEPQEITHLASGIASLKKRIDMIRGATDTIDMEYFIYQAEEDVAARLITQELIKAANKPSSKRPGEKIKVHLLVDSSATVLQLKDTYATMLKDNKVSVRYYNQSEMSISKFKQANLRNHRKTLIVDGREALTGGRNIGREYFDLDPEYNFLDTDVHISGSIVQTIQSSFDAYWKSPLSTDPKYVVARGPLGGSDPAYIKKMKEAKKMSTQTKSDAEYLLLVEDMGEKMLNSQFKTTCNDSIFVSDMPSDNKDSRRVFKTIKSIVTPAKSSLDIESPYFVVTNRGIDLFSELLKKPNFSINVQTNSLDSTDATYTVSHLYDDVKKLTSLGINIWLHKGVAPDPKFLATPKFKTPSNWGTHSKRAVVDGHTTMIGTYNVDPRSTDLNNEMIFICKDNKPFAESVLADMQWRRTQSTKLRKEDGRPEDNTNLVKDSNLRKKAEFYLFKPFVKIKKVEDLL